MALPQTDTAIGIPEVAPEEIADPPAQPATARSRRRLSRRARWGLVCAVLLLVAGGAVGAWVLFFRTSGVTTSLRTVTVAAETLKQSVSGTGILNPAKESDLSFSSSGTVTSVKVSAGDVVTKGQKLATIDDSELEIDYTSAKASLTEAEDSLSALEDDDDTTDTALAAARATVEVKKNAVTQAKAALADATLVSPIAGKVADVTIAKDDTVSGSASTTSSSANNGTGSGANAGTGSGTGTNAGTGSGTGSSTGSSASSSAAVTVISDGTFTVTTAVSNAEVTSVKKGLQATITPTGSTEPVFGTVSSVGVVASSSTSSGSGSATFPVTITVTGKQPTLLPGSSATVAITVKQLTNVLSVPTQAVSTVDGKTVVQKLVNGKQVATPVKLGAAVGASTVVASGVRQGDQIVLPSFRLPSGNGSAGGRTGQGGSGQGGFPGGSTFPRQGTGQGQGSGVPGGNR